jgi:hypothetical protein
MPIRRKFGATSGLLASHQWLQLPSRRGHQMRTNDIIIVGQNTDVA